MMASTFIKRNLIICFLFLIVLIFMACADNDNSERQLRSSLNDLKQTGISAFGLLDRVEGMNDEGYCYYRFHVSPGAVDEIMDEMSASCGEPFPVSADEIPRFSDNPVAAKLRDENITAFWEILIAGRNGAKTRTVDFYLTESDEDVFLYFFG